MIARPTTTKAARFIQIGKRHAAAERAVAAGFDLAVVAARVRSCLLLLPLFLGERLPCCWALACCALRGFSGLPTVCPAALAGRRQEQQEFRKAKRKMLC